MRIGEAEQELQGMRAGGKGMVKLGGACAPRQGAGGNVKWAEGQVAWAGSAHACLGALEEALTISIIHRKKAKSAAQS